MDVDNIFVNKIYTVSDDRYIGELRVAVNRNYVLHLLEDPDNGR